MERKKGHIDSENVDNANYSCSKCEFKTFSQMGLKLHQGSAHRQILEFHCELCELFLQNIEDS